MPARNQRQDRSRRANGYARTLRAALSGTRYRIRGPSYRWLRIPLGVLLILAGVLGFLPILGFWMIPLGLSLLAMDIPVVRRLLNRVKAALRPKS